MDERLGTDVLLYSRIISLYGLEILVEFSDISRLKFDLTNISAKDAVFWYNLDSAKIYTYFKFLRRFTRPQQAVKMGPNFKTSLDFGRIQIVPKNGIFRFS